MKKIYSFFVIIFLCIFAFNNTDAQIPVTVTNPTNTTPNLAASYTSLALALTDLNLVTAMSGPVTLTLTAPNSETAPVAGLTIGSATLNPVLSATNTVTVVNGGGGAVTLNAGVGTNTPGSAVQDGILKLVGADWITIDGLTLTDGNAANPATMEYGIALYKASATDGCQNNIIQNCIITLNRINNATGSGPSVEGSRGINVSNSTAAAATTTLTVTAASGGNSNNKFYTNTIQNCNYGIVLIGFADVSPFTFADSGNDVGGSSATTGNIIKNFGGGAVTNPAAGIRTLAQYGINISYNTINNNDGAGVNHATTLRGIFNNTAVSANVTITNNTVTVKSAATTSTLTAIDNAAGGTAAGNTVNISNNTITGCTYTTATSGAFTGIVSSVSAANVNLNNNTISSNATNATSGTTNLIQNSAAVTVALNMNDNTINGWTFNAANSGTLNCVSNSGSTVTALVSISRNNIQNITHSVAGTTAHNYINCANPTSSTANINNNKFTNLIVNTSGTINFMLRSGNMTATGTERCDSNSIVTAFSRTAASGTLNFFNANASSVTGSTMINNLNNFSNVTVTGTSVIAGWSNTEGLSGTSGPTKTVTNNTINNLNASTGSVTGMSINFSGGPSTVSNNTVSNITSAGSITGMTFGSSNSTTLLMTVSNNLIDPFTSTGASAVVTGIATASPVTSIFKNKMYDLVSNGATATVNGIIISAGTTVGVFNNLMGNLSAPSTSSTTDAVRGINMTSTTTVSNLNISYNTIYIQVQTSSGANFSSSGVFHTTSTTATTAQLNMRNNIIVNLANPNGTGNTVAYRRSNGAINTLANYGSTSNNNLFYAGTPGTTRLIYSDGTSSAQTISAYKNGVFTAGTISPRDAASISENPNFLSTTGSSASFLHINTTIATQIESGGANIAGISDDYDGDTRNGSTPDIGADEFAGIPADLNGPSIANTSLNDTCSTGNRNLNGVVITDPSGVASGAVAPRVYWNVNGGAWSSTATGSIASPYDFIIGTVALSSGDVVRFFVIAQDNVGNVSANPGAGLVATDVNTISTFPTSPNLYNIVCTDNVGITATNLSAVGVYSAGKGYNFTATVKNFGTVTQDTVPVFYTDNGGSPTGPVNTVGPIITNGTENVTFSGGFAFTPLSGGAHTLKIYTALAADTSKGNDTLTIVLNVNSIAKINTYPYIQTFTNPVGWTTLLENVVGTTPLWGLGICTNPDGKVGDTAATSNCFNGSAGRREVFRSPEMDFTSLTNPVLNFYVAYKTFSTENDSLEVLVSTNQGVSFISATTVFNKGNASVPSLATRPPSSTSFFPDSSIQWRHETISLSNIAGLGNIIIGFRSKSQFGNRQWVDNVIVTNNDSLCNNTVTTPGVYSCNPNLSLNFGTVGIRPTGNPEPFASNVTKSNAETQDSRILGKLNSTNWSGQIISSTELDNPTGGVATVLQFNSNANASGAGIATNVTATSQDGSILTPNKIIANTYWTASYTGNDKNGYATYSISINSAAFPGIPNYNKAYVVKRSDLLGKWVALNTTTSVTTLTAAGLNTFSDFALAVDSTSAPVALNDAGVYAASRIPSGTIYTGTNLCFDARVKNYGSVNETAIPVKYTVNGGSPIGPVNTGALNSGDTTSVSFCGAESFTPALAGSYTLKFFTSLTGDTSYANDTTTLLLTVIDSTRDAGVTSAVSIPAGTIYTGTNLCFNATVKNFGQAYLAAVPTYYTVNGGSPIGPVNTGALNSGDTTSVSFCGAESFTPALAGSYTLKFFTSLTGDTSYANDTATLVLSVIDSSKDAGVTSAVSIPSGTIYTGTNLCFNATVKNFGQAYLAAVPTYYTVNGGSPVGPVNSSSMASGDSTIVNFCGGNSYTPASAGSYILKFYTLLSGDANGANDTATLVLSVIDSSKDAGVTSAVSIPSGTIYTGTNLCFNATVKNFGQAYLTAVPTYYTVNGGSPVGPVNSSSMASGDSTIVNFCGGNSYTPASAGSYILKFYTLLSGDANGANDTATLVLSVIDSSKDAGVTSAVSIPSGTIYTGTNLCFNATVKNFGQAYLAAVPTYYTVNGGSPVGPVNSSSMASGDSTIVNFCGGNSYTPASAGSYILKFYTLLSGDANGANDTATLVLSVIDSSKDAGVTSAVSIPSGTIYTGTNLCFNATVKNFGQAYLAAVPTYYTVNGGSPVGPVNSSSMASGDSTIVNFCGAQSYTPASAGSYILKFYTLLSGDANGANDTATFVLSVIDSSKDAGVTSAVSIPSRTIYTGTNLCFNATVKNFGQAYLAAVPTYYTVNGGSPVGPVNSSSMASGDSTIVNFCGGNSYTPASAGSYILKFYTLLSGDDNGANDTVTLLLTVINIPTLFYVNDNLQTGDVYTTAVGNDVNSGTPAAPFLTITHAMTIAAATDTIYVDAGSYPENVIVSKQFVFLGAKAGVDARGRVVGSPSNTVESVIAPASGIVLNLSTNFQSTVLDGFVLVGSLNAPNGVITCATTAGLTNFQLKNNYVKVAIGFTAPAVFLSRGLIDATFSQNEFVAARGSTHCIQTNGPQQYHGLYFLNNNVLGNGGTYGIFVDGNRNVGISTGFANRAPRFQGNLFQGFSVGINAGVRSFDNVQFVENTLTNNAVTGFQGGPRKSNFARNTITFNGEYGMSLTGFNGNAAQFVDTTRGASRTTIQNNFFSNNATDVTRFGDILLSNEANGMQNSNIITGNSFGSDTAIFNNEPGGATDIIQAKCNWFGTAGVSAKIFNVSGGIVDYIPWLTDGTDDSLGTPGFQPLQVSCNGLPITGNLNLTVNLEAYSPLPDTITVTLRSATTPYPVVSTASGEIDANGDVSLNFSNISNGSAYYIIVNHRHSIETWSATGQLFTLGTMTYDFTTDISQAFGGNLTFVGSKASIYTSDVNQDYIVDISDLAIMENDVLNFVSGPYVITDLNGDDFVDVTDMAFVDNNAFNFVMIEMPTLSPETILRQK